MSGWRLIPADVDWHDEVAVLRLMLREAIDGRLDAEAARDALNLSGWMAGRYAPIAIDGRLDALLERRDAAESNAASPDTGTGSDEA